MKYRSRTDIIATILQAAMHGATKTRLMYGAFISYAQVQDYLKFLSERKLLSFDEGSQQYKLTEQGLRFLQVYDEISEIVSIEGIRASEKAMMPRSFKLTPSLHRTWNQGIGE